MASAMLQEVETLQQQAVREMHEQVRAERVRLIGLENTITLARPDFCEAAQSILAPMMAALEARYDWRECKSYQAMGDIKAAYQKLFDALMAADDAENS